MPDTAMRSPSFSPSCTTASSSTCRPQVDAPLFHLATVAQHEHKVFAHLLIHSPVGERLSWGSSLRCRTRTVQFMPARK